jgi:hypothetical protein
MKVDGYNSEELKFFYRVLEASIAEARAASLDLPVHEMTQRLFDAAARGERDPQNLRLAILSNANGPVNGPVSVRRHPDVRSPGSVAFATSGRRKGGDRRTGVRPYPE